MKMKYYENAFYGMGTTIEEKVASVSKRKAELIFSEISNNISDLEKKMSFFVSDSYLSHLNSSVGNFVKMDDDTFRVLSAAKKYYELSSGAFDSTIAPLSALWRDAINREILPSDEFINRLIENVSSNNLELNVSDASAKIKNGASIDLGGIGKGYAADFAINSYKKLGVTSAFINLGGNVHTLGKKTDGEPWIIGLQDPRKERGNFIAALQIEDKSVVTSGDYEKYFKIDSKRYHHIIDPKTGYPACSDLISATVVAFSSMEADALSTAVFILGLEKGMELIQKSGTEGVLITKEKKVFVTKGLMDDFKVQSNINDYKFYTYR